MAICKKCEHACKTMELKICKNCRITSDKDSSVLLFCETCAEKLGVCRSCGQKLKIHKK